MEPPSQRFFGQPTAHTWTAYPNASLESYSFQRTKHEQATIYEIGQSIGFGFNAVIYDVVSKDNSKIKAVKIYNQPISQKEYCLIEQLNSQGPQVGILKPAKAFFPALMDLNIPAMLVMSKYNASLADLLENNKITEADVFEALEQVVAGMQFLKDNSIYHGDINLRNILYKGMNNEKRYDIADFENGLDYSNFKTLAEFTSAMAERPPTIEYFDTLSLAVYSDLEATHLYRELLQRHDAACLGYMILELDAMVPKIVSNPYLNLLAKEIIKTWSIDHVAFHLKNIKKLLHDSRE